MSDDRSDTDLATCAAHRRSSPPARSLDISVLACPGDGRTDLNWAITLCVWLRTVPTEHPQDFGHLRLGQVLQVPQHQHDPLAGLRASSASRSASLRWPSPGGDPRCL